MKIEKLTARDLQKTFKRLKKVTGQFSKLIIRDAVDYIDFEVDLYNNLRHLVEKIESNSYIPSKPYFHYSPKSKGINRPTIVLDIFDAIVYRFCIENIEDEILQHTRQSNIRGGIKITANLTAADFDDFYEKWFKDWEQHQRNLRQSLLNKPFLVSTDISSYFENINILILKDSLRSDIKGKKELLNLLFYFLENARYRYDYEVNTFNGLVQENIDASRLLAYYFLKPHDDILAKFCIENNAEYYRFVDDMSITVNDEVVGRKALGTITESLRRLNLVSSIEKTEIIKATQANIELFFEENDKLAYFQEKLLDKISNNQPDQILTKNDIINYYSILKTERKFELKNWIKILKRFYTIATYGSFDLFSDEILTQIVKYPLLFSDTKIIKYTLRQEKNTQNKIINTLIGFLYSKENLYQLLETNILELFLFTPLQNLNTETADRLKKLSYDIYKNESSYKSLSYYSKALSLLLMYKLKSDHLSQIPGEYLKNNVDDPILRKHLIFTSLITDKQQERDKVLSKAKKEQALSIQRLINLIENADMAKNNSLVKKYINNNILHILYDPKKNRQITTEVDNVRARLLKQVLDIYG